MSPEWRRETPTTSGIYWYWSGDSDDEVLTLFVGCVGAGTEYFVCRVMVGPDRSVSCKEYGGWWCPVAPHPPLPTGGDDQKGGG